MGSYLAQLMSHRISLGQFLGKSVGYLASKVAGGNPVDAVIDDATTGATDLAAQLEASTLAYIQKHAPALPPEVAASVANIALAAIDTAITAASHAIKAAV